MKKILFVVNVDWFFVSHRLPIALEALENGYDVHLACKFTDKTHQLQRLGITCHNIDFSRSGASLKSELHSLVSLRCLIKNIGFDIVHAITVKPVIYSGFVLKTIKFPPAFVVAISGLGYVFSAKNFRAKLTRMFVTLMYKLALSNNRKVVIFQNDSDKSILNNIVGLSDTDTTLIKGSGVDLTVYSYKPEPEGRKTVVSMACRLLKEKGVYEFVEAAKLIKKIHSDIEFWLIGSVDVENPNSVSNKEINIWIQKGIIKALGHRKDIPDLFAQSHIVTLPSFYGEGVPKVLIEAAACGRPIVTTLNSGCKDTVINGETGLLIPKQDSDALAEALLALINNQKKRVEMGLKARQFALKEFDIVNVVEKHLKIYESLTQQ